MRKAMIPIFGIIFLVISMTAAADIIHTQVEIGKPVKWTTTIAAEEIPLDSIAELKLSKDADNIKVYDRNTLEEIEFALLQEKGLKRLFSNLKTITGLAVSDGENVQEQKVMFVADDSDYVIEYETEAPLVMESEKTEGTIFKKSIRISSDIHYTDILSYTDIPDTTSENVRLYHRMGGLVFSGRVDITDDPLYKVEFLDMDGNGFIDRVKWVTPHLSVQDFEVEVSLEIINVQSYPVVGDYWTVRFITSGTGDLAISAINGTEFGREEPDDLEWIGLRCGDNEVPAEFDGRTVYVDDYACSETSYHTVKVLSLGRHYQELNFAGLSKVAKNNATLTGIAFFSDSGCTEVIDEVNPTAIGENAYIRFSWSGEDQDAWAKADDYSGTCTYNERSGCISNTTGVVSSPICMPFNADVTPSYLTAWANLVTASFRNLGGNISLEDAQAVLYVNHDPVLDSISIIPSSASPGEALRCRALFTDTDAGQAHNSSGVWMINGANTSFTNSSCSSTGCSAFYSSTLDGDEISCLMNVTDAFGLSSSSMWSASVTISDTRAPAAPQDLQASDVAGDQGGNISLTWTRSTDDGSGDNDVIGYYVMRSTTSSGGYVNITTLLSPGTESHYDNVGISNDGIRFYYRIRVCDNSTPENCESSSYASAVANARPLIVGMNHTPISPSSQDNITFTAFGSDSDRTNVSMRYQVSVTAMPPGGSDYSATGSARCTYLGINASDSTGRIWPNATTECSFTLDSSRITLGDRVTATFTANDGYENSTSRSTQGYIVINNSRPFASDVYMTPSQPNESSTLSCEYTYNDPDGSPEDTAMARYKWYINNEGLNSFVEVLGAVDKTFSGIFDKDDIVKCAVMVRDTDPSSANSPLYDDEYVESSQTTISNNAIPQIISYSDSTSSSNPAIRGEDITFSVEWIDFEDPLDMARIYVCDDFNDVEEQYVEGNASASFGDYSNGTANPIWIYTNETGQYVYRIAVMPFKYVRNNMMTFAVETEVESGDFDLGLGVTEFANETYYDKDLSETYDRSETIILQDPNRGSLSVYDRLYDTVIIGAEPPEGAPLSNFSIGNVHKFRDITGNGFTEDDDIYHILDGGLLIISEGDIRKSIVSQGPIDSLSTEFIYDIIVREVSAPGETQGTVIARDRDNSLTMGVYNYFVPQFNAQPRAGMHLAFQFCIDHDNNDVCDSNEDYMNDRVYIEVVNSTSGYLVRDSSGNLYSNPPVEIYYGLDDVPGCTRTTYCSTSNSMQNDVSCIYATKATDLWNNTYRVKVCDEHDACSDFRTGNFYTKNLPNITMIRLNTSDRTGNFTTDRNLVCEYNYTHDLPVTPYYSWYLNRGGSGFIKQNFPNVDILSNTNTEPDDLWKCSVKLYDGTDWSAENVSKSILISGGSILDLQVVSVSHDSPAENPKAAGEDISFSIYWVSPTSIFAKAYICATSNITSTGCMDRTIGASQFTVQNPIDIVYSSREDDSPNVTYWVKVCQDDWNCSESYPITGGIFSVNHRPEASPVTVEYLNSSSVNCSFQFADWDMHRMGDAEFIWWKDSGLGFSQMPGETEQILTVESPYNEVFMCSVLVYDEFGLSDSTYRNSSNSYTFGTLPGQAILYNAPRVDDKLEDIWIVGYYNETPINVSVHARQDYNISDVVVEQIEYNSTYYGSALPFTASQKNSGFIIISGTYHNVFQVGRKIEFSNHDRPFFERYDITQKTNLLDGTYKIFISPALESSITSSTRIRIYNSSYPKGWFNITLPDLFEGANTIWIRGNSSQGQGPYLSFSLYTDLESPETDISTISDWTTGLTPTIKWRVTDNYAVNLSSIRVNVTGESTARYSYESSGDNETLQSITCYGIFTNYTCELMLNLTDLEFYNISFHTEDLALRKNKTLKLNYFVNTSIQPLSSVVNGFVDDSGTLVMPAVIATNNTLSAAWTALPSGSAKSYEYKLEEYDQSGLVYQGDIVSWTDIGLNNSINVTAALRNRYIYKFVVRIKWIDETYSSEKSSGGIVYYVNDAPRCIGSCVKFVDSSGRNISFTKTNSLRLNWSFYSEASITQYRVVIGTSRYPYPGYNNILDSTVTSTYVDYSGLFTNNQTIYANVRAMNENGIWSNWLDSSIPTLVVDKVAPYGGNISYQTGIVSTNITLTLFDGYDSISGIRSRELYRSVREFVRGSCQGVSLYYNIRNMSSGVNSYTDIIQNGKCYRYKYRITDYAGNSIDYPGSEGYDVMSDFTNPTEFTVTLNQGAFVTTSDELSVTWTPSDDPESGISHYSYVVQEDGMSLGSWANLTDPSNTTLKSVTIKLDYPLHQASYKVIVTAYSKTYGTATLQTTSESNSVVYLDVTPPDTVSIIRVENDTSGSGGLYYDLVDNGLTIAELDGERGITCIASEYRIDYERYDVSKDYLINCSRPIPGESNFTCEFPTSADGDYTYYVMCEDSTGNAQFSAAAKEVAYTVDVKGPIITVGSPTELEVVGDKVSFSINITDTTPIGDPYYWIVNRSNDSQIVSEGRISAGSATSFAYDWLWDSSIAFSNKTANLSLIINVNDTLKHESTYIRNLTVDNTRPVISILMPNIDDRHFNENFNLNIEVTNNPVSTGYNITHQNGTVFQSNSTLVSGTTFIWTDTVMASTFPDGIYMLKVSATDVLESSQNKEFTFYIDRTPPRYLGMYTIEEPIYNSDYVILRVTWPTSYNNIANTNDIEIVTIEHNATGAMLSYNPTRSGDNYSLFITSDKLDNGEAIHWRSTATDFSGNMNQTAYYSFTVMNRKPSLNMNATKVEFRTYQNATLNASRYISDADMDPLTYNITFMPSGLYLYDDFDSNGSTTSNYGRYLGIIQKDDGRTGDSILVEMPITNLISEPSLESVLQTGGAEPGIWYAEEGPSQETEKISGEYSARVNRNNYYYQIVSVSPSTRYALSAYMKSEAGSTYGRLHIDWLDISKNYISSTLCSPGCDNVPLIGPTWERKSAVMTSPSNARFAKVYADSQNSTYILVDDMQLERGNYSTTFTAISRTAGYAEYDISSVTSKGSAVLWVSPVWSGNNTEARILMSFDGPSNLVVAALSQGGIPYITISSLDLAKYDISNWTADSWHMIALSWSMGYTSLYVDGQFAGSSYITPSGGRKLTVGRHSTIALYSNARFDDLSVWDYPLSASEIQDLYSASGIEEDVTDKLYHAFEPSTTSFTIYTNGSWYGNYSAYISAEDGWESVSTNIFAVNALPDNSAPSFTVPDMQVNETNLLSYQVSASDIDRDRLTYAINASYMNISSTGLIRWLTTTSDVGVHDIHLMVCDNSSRPNNCTSEVFRITVLLLDFDGDGVSDTIDYLLGDNSSIILLNQDNISVGAVQVLLNGSENISRYLEGAYNVTIFAGGLPVASFMHDFQPDNLLDLSGITIGKNSPSGPAYTYIKGIDSEKTLFVQNLNGSISTVCIKDSPDVDFSDISSDCGDDDETLVNCTGTFGQYSCTDLGTIYMISGISHSAVAEMNGCRDIDGDGFGFGFLCLAADCDDTDPAINPSATEIPYDLIDQDCDGLDLLDADADGYCRAGYAITDASAQCPMETGATGTDCDDTEPTVNPSEAEVHYDGIDQDCNGHDIIDADDDGYCRAGFAITNSTVQCTLEEGMSGTDCDDTNSSTNPGAPEIYYDGMDQDCNGHDALDADDDGYCRAGYPITDADVQCPMETGATGTDCNDINAAIHPGATEIKDNSIDEDCDGKDLKTVTSSSGGGGGGGSSGFVVRYQCSDKIDNDGDGLIDMDDPGCESITDNDETDPCSENWICSGWGACLDGKQYKECKDLNSCGTSKERPLHVMDCQIQVLPSCTDGIKNGLETDVDCGGDCKACEDGRSCMTDADCRNVCGSSNLCITLEVQAVPTCRDGIQNGEEEGTDCGGPCMACASYEEPSGISIILEKYGLTFILIALAAIILIFAAVVISRREHPVQETVVRKDPMLKDESYYRKAERKEILILFEMLKRSSGEEIERVSRENGIANSKAVLAIQNYYLEMTTKGEKKEAIREKLLEKGWPIDLIEFTFAANEALDLADKIVPGIKAWKDQGYDDNRIRDALARKGYAYQIINFAFKLYDIEYVQKDKRRIEKMKKVILEIYKGVRREKLQDILEKKDASSQVIQSILYMDNFIKEELRKGEKQDIISERLLSMGYEKEIIGYALQLTNLQIEILSMIRAGKDLRDIKKTVRDKGLPEEIVDRMVSQRPVQYDGSITGGQLFVLNALHKGITKESIIETLHQKGYPETIQEYMIKVDAHIASLIRKGYTKSQVKEYMKRYGWPEEVLERILEYY